MKSFEWQTFAQFEERGFDGYGRVWSAVDSTDDAVIIHELDSSQVSVDAVESMLSVHDPNVVGVLQVDAEQGMLVQEAVNGITLRRYLTSQKKLSQPVACAVMAQVASGWAAVQAAGLLAGDFRPENILINLSVVPNQLRLGVFGFPELARTTMPLGYSAPELIRGEAPTKASDAYAFGATWYELLTGETPGAGLSPVDRLNFVPQRPSGISSEIWFVLAPLLSVSPEDRPTNAAELSMRLFRLMPATAVKKAEPSAPQKIVPAGESRESLHGGGLKGYPGKAADVLGVGRSWIHENTFIAVLIAVAVAIVFMVVLVVMVLNGITSFGDRLLGGVQTSIPSASESISQSESPEPTGSSTEEEPSPEISVTPTPTTINPGIPSGASSCTTNIWVNSSTSCGFAENVAASYATRGLGTYDVRSPATGQSYSMTCSALNELTVVCRGGNSAEVFIVR